MSEQPDPSEDDEVELVTVHRAEGAVGIVEIRRPPHNYVDVDVLRAIADAYNALDADDSCRAIVLCSEGKHFSAGADHAARIGSGTEGVDAAAAAIYTQARRLFRAGNPTIAAIQGAAVGGGLGLALTADLRVAATDARFAANFVRLGFFPGFGLTCTLPRLIGGQASLDMLTTGRWVQADEAAAMRLCDRLVDPDGLRDAAVELARQVASAAPLAVAAVRARLRSDLSAQIDATIDEEAAEQARLRRTLDFREGLRAAKERRTPAFEGR